MLAGKHPRESLVEMTELVLPSDANPLGTIFGGRVMQWIDIAGGIAAARHSRRPSVTASMDALHFHAPIHVGEFAVLEAKVLAAFSSSMECSVTVHSENPLTGERTLCTTALLTFVALAADGKPMRVPPVLPETEDERKAYADAHLRRQRRLEAARGG